MKCLQPETEFRKPVVVMAAMKPLWCFAISIDQKDKYKLFSKFGDLIVPEHLKVPNSRNIYLKKLHKQNNRNVLLKRIDLFPLY